ncbi:glycosyltransferase family 1 protein [Sulfuricurvum sp.]|uniref:glycosyltransferase family 4 protein n=1 Tax=Sulfuricurvum sp. TaxID=2025608 RepID=UPI00260C572A|nr:glycosyltransferase family 1 protein [Sulfuricurvum sp.]MDD2266030.1 glycosyltransferase family 1 protein [Sulfuricurvum sp.]MDD2783042.1 glycosyltransferase family 1 protein [Sulfuricurvum sp.]
MRLIVNCSPLRPPLTGIGHYTREVLLRLIEDPEIDDMEGFYFHRWLSREQIRTLLYPIEASSQTFSRSFAQRVAALPGGRELYRLAIRWLHRNNLVKRKEWLYWETNYTPLPFEGKIVTTVYDLSHVRFPQFHPKSRVSFFNNKLPKALSESAAILTISDFSAHEIMEFYGIEKTKITIVPPAISPVFHPRTRDEIESFRRRCFLPPRYLLSVATLEPRKNFKNLCLAYASLDESIRMAFPLVLAGASGWLSDDLEALMSPLEEQGHIIRLGYVPASDLPVLYAAADALCYLSLYEGYGMPIAEAIASNIPVLTSDCTSMPEAGGNRAWYATPTSVVSIADMLQKMLSSATPLHPHSSAHLPPPRIHSWENAAASIMALFRFCYNCDQ